MADAMDTCETVHEKLKRLQREGRDPNKEQAAAEARAALEHEQERQRQLNKPFPDMRDLTRLRMRNPILNAFWKSFELGNMTFEKMLVAALVTMTESADEARAALFKKIEQQPAPFTFPV